MFFGGRRPLYVGMDKLWLVSELMTDGFVKKKRKYDALLLLDEKKESPRAGGCSEGFYINRLLGGPSQRSGRSCSCGIVFHSGAGCGACGGVFVVLDHGDAVVSFAEVQGDLYGPGLCGLGEGVVGSLAAGSVDDLDAGGGLFVGQGDRYVTGFCVFGVDRGLGGGFGLSSQGQREQGDDGDDDSDDFFHFDFLLCFLIFFNGFLGGVAALKPN